MYQPGPAAVGLQMARPTLNQTPTPDLHPRGWIQPSRLFFSRRSEQPFSSVPITHELDTPKLIKKVVQTNSPRQGLVLSAPVPPYQPPRPVRTLQFEKAATLRDRIKALKAELAAMEVEVRRLEAQSRLLIDIAVKWSTSSHPRCC